MKKSPHFKYRLFNLYNYSKKRISYKQHVKFFIIFASNTLFGILIYLSIDLFKTYPDKTPLYLLFLITVALSAYLSGLYSSLLTTGIILFEAFFLFRDFFITEMDLILYIQLAFFISGAIIISYLINLTEDTSEVKKLKKQEKSYASAFIQLHDEYAVALRNIKARDQFLSIVSHELKTPLTVMLLKLHSMLNRIQSVSLANFSIKELMKVLKNSEQQIKWLTLIINDLLDVSLITTGRMNLQLVDTDLVSVTKQVKQSFSELIKRGKYEIEIHAESSVIGRWDKGRIEQVITNLLSNTIKYGEGRPIVIKIFRSGNQGKFIIKDEGIGIPQQDQKVIFDLFKRASRPKEYKKGLGVGLFITSQIVKMHGGRIKVSSMPKKGTSFTLELPLNKTNTYS